MSILVNSDGHWMEFTFIDLVDKFILSSLICVQGLHFISWTHDLGIASATLYRLSYKTNSYLNVLSEHLFVFKQRLHSKKYYSSTWYVILRS